ncbi:hypothetical protein EBR16_04190 [bacterium]|jgi:hypothetical protein|nr:hypothetical protein [bacterium]
MRPAPGLIELRLNNVGQLFNTMDPSPFHERDLDHDAEEFIVSWAREHRAQSLAPLRLRVVLHQPPDPAVTALVQQSIGHYFAYRAEVSRRELQELLREGRTALAIGLAFLAATLALRGLLPLQPSWCDWIREGLTISGWVALWKPIDIHLYRWWPLRAQARLQARIAASPVEVDFQP